VEKLLGIYAGFVESASDPQHLGRLKVRVPVLHGPLGDNGTDSIGTDNLAWALPSGLPLGSTPMSGGFAWLPALGDQVFVQFLDGEPEKPVWSWGVRPIKASSDYTFYAEDGKETPALAYTTKGKPADRKVITAYGQSILLTPAMLHLRNASGVLLELSSKEDYGLLSTATGYSVAVAGSTAPGSLDGTVTLSTEGGITFTLDDSIKSAMLNATSFAAALDDANINLIDMTVAGAGNLDVEFSGNSRLVSSNALELVSSDLKLSASRLSLTATALELKGAVAVTGNTTITGTFTTTGKTSLGGGFDPVVRLSDLAQVVLWLNMHTHGNGNMGSPTTGPMVPLLSPTGSPSVTAV